MRDPGCSWSDKHRPSRHLFLYVTHHNLFKRLQRHSRYYQPTRPFRRSTYLRSVILGIFKASKMPFYEAVWPPWTWEEDLMLMYFCSRGFELRTVTRIMAYKLHRAVRTDSQCMNHMERFNRDQEQKGLQRLCIHGMADWNMPAVDTYLIHSTHDAAVLEDLLTFHRQYERLLREVCPATAFLVTLVLKAIQWHAVPLNEVLNLRRLQQNLQQLIDKHRSIYGHPWRFGGHFFR